MNPTFKAVLLFISFVLLCGLIFYSITVYDKWETRKQDREDRLAEHDRENDSLKTVNGIIAIERGLLKNERDSLINSSNAQTNYRQNVYTNAKKRNEQYSKNPVAVNKQFNDNYILNYKPIY